MAHKEYKTKVVDGREVYFCSDWIEDLEREVHFSWYYHQAKLVYDHCSRNHQILEIGVGTGLLSDVLKKRGWNIQTLDIDEAKKPDYCESASDFDYHKHNLDVVLAFEIFEHIPFAIFEKIIQKLGSCNIRKIYFSVPWNQRKLIDVKIKLPKLPFFAWEYTLPVGHIETKSHFWELTEKPKILGQKELISRNNLKRVFSENNYQFFELNKIDYIQYFAAIRV